MIAAPYINTTFDLFITCSEEQLNYESEFGKAVRATCNRFKYGATWTFTHYGLAVKIITTDADAIAETTRALTALAKRWDGRRGLDFKKN